MEYFAYGEINKRIYSNPHPCWIKGLRSVQKARKIWWQASSGAQSPWTELKEVKSKM